MKPRPFTWLAIGGLAMLGFGIAGCPAFIAGSMVGSLSYGGYEYAKTGTVPGMPQLSQPSAKPTPSLNDIE